MTRALLALVVFFAFGVLYFSLAEGFTVIDSLYFTVVVLTTVGYGDLGPFSARAKVVICFFVLYAMLLAAQAFGILTNAALQEGRGGRGRARGRETSRWPRRRSRWRGSALSR